LFQEEHLEIRGTGFLQAAWPSCKSCYPTNGVKALKGLNALNPIMMSHPLVSSVLEPPPDS